MPRIRARYDTIERTANALSSAAGEVNDLLRFVDQPASVDAGHAGVNGRLESITRELRASISTAAEVLRDLSGTVRKARVAYEMTELSVVS